MAAAARAAVVEAQACGGDGGDGGGDGVVVTRKRRSTRAYKTSRSRRKNARRRRHPRSERSLSKARVVVSTRVVVEVPTRRSLYRYPRRPIDDTQRSPTIAVCRDAAARRALNSCRLRDTRRRVAAVGRRRQSFARPSNNTNRQTARQHKQRAPRCARRSSSSTFARPDRPRAVAIRRRRAPKEA